MLRITINDGSDERRWLLEGRLVGLSVVELGAVWQAASISRDGRRWVIDLSDMTGIDQCGEELLKTMREAGAEFIASGVYMTHLVDVISSQRDGKVERE